MWAQEYDYEKELKVVREEAKEEGIEVGILNCVELLYSITNDANSTISQIADKFGVSKDYVFGIVKKHNIIKQ